MDSSYTVTIKETTQPTILKFELNKFITTTNSYEFNSIDEAKNAPLAQQLFYLPFVKKVYISSNFIAIERYNIVSWHEVKEEVALQIKNYLNEGGILLEESKLQKKVAITIYAESTPNPKVQKFVANKKLVTQPYEFKSIDEAKNAPLAMVLFRFPYVKEVFIDENYVAVTKYDIAEWQTISMELREAIYNFLATNNSVVDSTIDSKFNETPKKDSTAYENLDVISQEIIALLNEYVKPAVASDGGNIQFESYNPATKTVRVILQGACSGCPSASLTLKNGIETMLKELLNNKVEKVIALEN